MSTPVVLAYPDYAALPADGRHYELHDGELSVTPAPSPRHQEVSGNLWDLLHHYLLRGSGSGKVFYAPIDCILSETTIVQPDLVYVGPGARGQITPRGIEGPPTLVVEILSPSTLQIDRGVKLQLYARYGIPHYWIVDPDGRDIVAHALGRGAYAVVARLAGAAPVALPPFPDLVLDPASIWP
ncbi:MAG TPA: Uma2 family endonuclease [Methylomirabilota bacterium]|nr:Uma2 family endonuclease [Methylomirabilota bacterium]